MKKRDTFAIVLCLLIHTALYFIFNNYLIIYAPTITPDTKYAVILLGIVESFAVWWMQIQLSLYSSSDKSNRVQKMNIAFFGCEFVFLITYGALLYFVIEKPTIFALEIPVLIGLCDFSLSLIISKWIAKQHE